ncbi:hypothetical protein EZV62_017260 [Acer yangbiense]|uniref:Disease resistance N-terminal domain-containing protein n=1 Tax=Acer yangbiense TaxID=1000413 RepID=A0A5C7HG47_9ROSI|nr:hypothetical protein EZV62_017260 [Acer yangbiense]
MSVVGGAALSAFFSVLFDKLASQFLEHIKNLGVDDTQLQRLKNTITMVYVVLSNADELQFLNPLVKQLMDELNDVIYLAEDLVDEVNYLVVAKHQGKCKTSIMNFNDKFEKMILKLENAVKHRDIFDLMKKGIGEKTSPRLPTTSLVDESKTYGRELDKSLVMKFLMNGNAVDDIFKALQKARCLRTVLRLGFSTLGRTDQVTETAIKSFLGAQNQQFSKLLKLHLLNCDNLTGKLLPCYLPLLEELYMKDCLKLKFPCDDGSIKYEKLQILKIENSCDELWAFNLNSFEMLEDLFIENCSLLIYIRVPKEAHLSIKKLKIHNCNHFRGFLDYYAAHFPSIMTLSISHCRELLSFPKGGLPSNLQSLLIEKCYLVTAMDAWGLNNMASLTHLTIIGGSPGLNLKSFPAKGLLPASLTSLVFGEFRELEILDLNGLELLSSLEMMEIKTCVRLRSMSEEGRLPNSLNSLEITECLMLTERCQYGGEDWEKISRITNKVINGEVMLVFVLHLSGNNSWPAFAFHSVHLTQIQQQPYEFG